MKKYFSLREEKRNWENPNWIHYINKITPHIINDYMQIQKKKLPNLIEIERDKFDFVNNNDFNNLLSLISNQV